MAFVHVIARNVVVTERAKYAHTADAEQNFLAKTIVGIATVKAAGEIAVALFVRGKIGVEKIDGHNVAACADGVITPGAEFDAAAFEWNGDTDFFFLEKILDPPFDRFFGLDAIIGQHLREVAFAIEQRDRNHGKLEVCRCANRVAC